MIPIAACMIAILLSNLFYLQINNGGSIQFHGKTYLFNKGYFYALVLLPFYIIYAFQFSTSADYYNYSVLYTAIGYGIRAIKEPIIYGLFKLINIFHLDFQFVYFLIYGIAFLILYNVLSLYSKDITFSMVLLTCVFFALTLHQIRQLLAVVISFAAFKYIIEKNICKFLFVVLLACMCHISAIIMLPAYFLLRYQYKLSDIIIFGCGCIATGIVIRKIIPILIKQFVPSRLNWYNNFKNANFLKWDIILLTIFVFILLIYQKQVINNQINKIFINSFIIYLLLFFFCRWIPEVKRWGYFYFFPIIALIPNCLAEEKNKMRRLLYSFIILLCLFAYILLAYKKQLHIYSLRLLFF